MEAMTRMPARALSLGGQVLPVEELYRNPNVIYFETEYGAHLSFVEVGTLSLSLSLSLSPSRSLALALALSVSLSLFAGLP